MATNSVQRFPTKEELIKRMIHEFQLYHQFEFEDEIRQNNDMQDEDFDTLFKAGRAFKAEIKNPVSADEFGEPETKDIYADEDSSDSEEERPGLKAKGPKKPSPGAVSTWFITLDLNVEENLNNKQYYEL